MLKHRPQELKSLVAEWQDRNLISSDQVPALIADIDARAGSRGLSFTNLIAIVAAACLFLASLSFVAANWDAIPRLVKLAVLIGAMWTAWIGGIWCKARGSMWASEALVTLGSGLFGVNIMLIAQMYHLQGEAVDAVWMWAVGSAFAAALTRSRLTLLLAIALWFIWLVMDAANMGRTSDLTATLGYALPFAGLVCLALWMRARAAGHLLVLSFLGWEAVTLLRVSGAEDLLFPLFAITHVALVGPLLLAWSKPSRLRSFAPALLIYSLLAALIYVFVLYLTAGDVTAPALTALPVALACLAATLAQVQKDTHRYDIWAALGMSCVISAAFVWPEGGWLPALAGIALTIWSARMGWRVDVGGLRGLGIVGTALMLSTIYAVTVGDSLMGTAGFFLVLALILLGTLYGWRVLARSKAAQTGETS